MRNYFLIEEENNTGTIVGAVIGSLAAVGLVVGVVVFLGLRQKKKREQEEAKDLKTPPPPDLGKCNISLNMCT